MTTVLELQLSLARQLLAAANCPVQQRRRYSAGTAQAEIELTPRSCARVVEVEVPSLAAESMPNNEPCTVS